MKPVLIIVTSETCAHCVTYKKYYHYQVMDWVKQKKQVNLIELHLSDGLVRLAPEHHPDLKRYVRWFPQFLLFTGESWGNRQGKLDGIIMGGEMVNGTPETVEEKMPPLNGSNIIRWATEHVSNNNISQIPPAANVGA